jgi:DNA adenine methylase
MRHLRRFKNTKEGYYLVRDEMVFKYVASRAARFIYLNQTSFNGIYRVNLRGSYNVPYGYRDKEFFNKDKLRKVSDRLNNIEFSSGDFAESIDKVKEGDLFTKGDQIRLADHIDAINSKAAFYISTKAAHDEVKFFLVTAIRL